ncbi:MAG: MmgE/PrpD family protein [bacterium]
MTEARLRSSLVRQLGEFAARVDLAGIPSQVLDKAKACVLHGLVVGAASADLKTTRIARSYADSAPVPGGARVLISGVRTAPSIAAYANGTLFHSRIQEDCLGVSHFGTMVIPAALAAAELSGCTGKRFLEGVLAGYEVGGAVSGAYGTLLAPRGFRGSPVLGPLGAAAAAAHVMGLSAEQAASAIAFAAAFAGGTLEGVGVGTEEFPFQNGVGAANGFLAAQIASQGALGASSALEGQAGFLSCFYGKRDDWSGMASHLGEEWKILKVFFKPYPVCALNQTPVTLALQLFEKLPFSAGAVAEIAFDMPQFDASYPGILYKGELASVSQAQVSTAFVIALALCKGELTHDGLRDLGNPDIKSLMERIEIRVRPERQPLTGRLTVRLCDGRTAEQSFDGDPWAFYGWDFAHEVEFARRLAPEAPFPRERIEALIEQVAGLEELPDLAPLVDLLVLQAGLGLAATRSTGGSRS